VGTEAEESPWLAAVNKEYLPGEDTEALIFAVVIYKSA
jgi:hypothetical protein